MEIIYDLDRMNKKIDDAIEQLKLLKSEINQPFEGMTTDKKRVEKFIDSKIEGYYLANWSMTPSILM